MEKYIVDGKGYDVSPEKLETFLQEFPNAVKYQEPGKTTDSSTETQTMESSDMDSGSGDGGLVYEYQTPDKARFPDAVPAWGKSTDGGKNFEVVDANEIPEDWFSDPKFKQVYDQENKPQKLKDADAEKLAREALTNFYGDVSGIPKWALPYVTNFTGGAAGLVSGLFKTVESTAENLIGMTADEQREDGVNPVSEALDSFHDFTDAFDTKYYDEKGNALQVDQLLEKKEYGQALKLASEQAAESAPSMIASIYNPVIGGALMGVSTTGTTYKDDLKNRPEEALNDVIGNAMWAGGSEFLTEWAGGKFFRSLNGLKKSGAAEDVIRDHTKNYVTRFVGRTLGSGVGESITESVNSLIQDGGEVLFYDDKKTQKELISNVINSAVPALLMGGFGGGISSVSKQEKSNVYKFVAPQKWKQEHLNLGKQIYEASNDLDQAEESMKPTFEQDLKNLQNKKKEHEKTLVDSFDSMSDKEIIDYAKNIDAVNKNLNIINNNKYSESAQKKAEQRNIELIQDNLNSIGQEYTGKDVEVEKTIGEALKSSEIIEERLKKAKGINKEDLEINILKTEKDIEALSDANKDGVKNSDGAFIGKDKNGKATIYINQNVAAMAGATNVLGHELLHYMVSKKFKTDNESMAPLVDELKTYLKDNHSDVFGRVQQRIDKFYTNKNGSIKDGALEEYLNVFSDLIATKKIDIKEVQSKGLKNEIKDVMAGFGFGQIKLDSAKDVVSFLSTYNKNINRKGLLGKLMGAKILDIELTSKKLTEGEAKGANKKSMSTAEIKQVEERVTEIGLTYSMEGGKKLWDEGGSKAAINEIVKDGLLDNLIASKYKVSPVPPNFVKDVLAQLSSDIKGFNPEENNDFGGYLGPRINFRAGDIYKKIYEKKGPVTVPTEAKTKEGEVKIQIAAETDAAMKAFETEDLSPAAQAAKKSEKQKRSDLDKKLNLTEVDINKFISTLEKAFGTKLPPVTSKEYRQALEKIITTDLKNTIQNIFGKGVDYDIFVEQDIPLLLRDIRVEALIQMEREVGGKRFPNGKKIFATKRRITKVKEVRELQAKGLIGKDVKPESGPNLSTRLPRPNKKEINAWFRGINMKEVLGYELSKSAFGTRKDRFAENLAIEIGFNKAMQVVQDSKILAKRLAIEELQGREQIENYVAEVGRTIDRDPNVKYSKNIDIAKKEYDLGNADLSILLKENSLGQIEANYPLLYDALILDFEQKYGPQEFVNKRYLNLLTEANPELSKLVKDKVHITRKKVKGEYVFEVKMLDDHFKNYSLGLLDFIPSFMGVRENNVKGNYKILENAIAKVSSSRGNGGDTLVKRKNNRKKFRNKLNDMGKLLTPETKKLWSKFNKVKNNLELAESTFDMPETLLRDLRRIQRSNKTAKQKIKEAQRLFNPGALDAAQKLFTAYNASVQDWVNYQVNNNNMTREEAIAYVIRDKQKNTNFTKGERALAAFTSVYLENGVQKLEKKDSKGEHVKDSATVSGETTISIYNNTFIQDALSILNGFEQSYVPKKFADEMDRLGGANSPLKNFRFILNPKIGKSVYDLATGKTMYDLGLEQYKLNQVKVLGEVYLKNKNNKPLNNAIKASRTVKPSKGITVLDFDDTLATSKSSVLFTAPNGTTGKLTAEEFAKQGADLLAQGYVYDFSEFNKVVKGKKAPLFEKALKLQSKFGPENMFILTARPAESAASIFEFIKANGLNIPLKNITGLANSTAEAKALWMVDKVSEGYNDFYFADDALQNVQAVDNILEQFDVKRKVQQARLKFSKSMNDQFNDILENVTGIESNKRFSIIKGRKRGESKGKFRVFIPPSHEDFVGLLYNFLGRGKEGNAHRDFFEQALIRPLNRANREYDTARQSVANDYKELNKQFEDVRKKLTKKTADGDFTFQDAIRVYLWDKHGHKIPGLSETDQAKLAELVMSDPQLQAYAETLNVISKQETYVNPTDGWNGGDIRMDLDDATGRIGRKQFFSEFIENADVIFSEENLNKIEAGYGKGVRESLEDMLYRIETGRNRPTGQNEQVNKLMNYLNGSVGTVMFFNMRSALLQQMSIVNYINFADNNIFAAAKAFANQKQYWKDFAFIFNSDMLKQRRGGIQTDINGAELAASLRNSKDITRKLISKLLELGFLPTQIGDNIAIATGGAAYYRNRINKYIKQGMSQKEAEAAAFTDFQDITQSTQQSARPDMVSKQQASVIGKVILNFQNVTSQFNRLGKKAFQDIYNRRITKPNSTQMQSDISNAARITYYFAIQNAIFYTLQTALFAMMFDDDEEDVNNLFIKKRERLINGSIDSVLRGTGLIGGVVATLKNVAIAFARQRDVKYNPDESAVGLEALNLSPVLGIKFRKIVNAEKTLNYNKKVIKEMETFDIDNPQWSAVTNYTEAFTNVPLNRLYNKTQNVRQALNNDHSAWERTLMFLGWSQYNLDLENKKMEEIKEKTKGKKKTGRTARERKAKVR